MNTTPLKERSDTERKETPIYQMLINYFPDAIVALADRSAAGHKQYWPDVPVAECTWNRGTSSDDKGSLMRHIMDGDWDAAAWRCMAILQKEIEGKRTEEEAKPVEMRIGYERIVASDSCGAYKYTKGEVYFPTDNGLLPNDNGESDDAYLWRTDDAQFSSFFKRVEVPVVP